jgi:hypothetical protein
MTTKEAASHLHDHHTGLYPVTNILYVFKAQTQVKMSESRKANRIKFSKNLLVCDHNIDSYILCRKKERKSSLHLNK